MNAKIERMRVRGILNNVLETYASAHLSRFLDISRGIVDRRRMYVVIREYNRAERRSRRYAPL